jgi:predicted outer membrane repeat protein
MLLRVLLGLSGLFVFIPAVLFATTYTVRQDGTGDFTTIGDAVAAAADNDSIDVGPGTYGEHVDVSKSLTILGTSGQTVTIWDGTGTGIPLRVLDPCTVYLKGFTFTRGYAAGGGGLVVSRGPDVTAEDCTFHDNYATYDGGAVYVKGPVSSLDLNNCTFTQNHADHNAGAGIVLLGGTMNITSCFFKENTTNVFCVTQPVLEEHVR